MLGIVAMTLVYLFSREQFSLAPCILMTILLHLLVLAYSIINAFGGNEIVAVSHK